MKIRRGYTSTRTYSAAVKETRSRTAGVLLSLNLSLCSWCYLYLMGRPLKQLLRGALQIGTVSMRICFFFFRAGIHLEDTRWSSVWPGGMSRRVCQW